MNWIEQRRETLNSWTKEALIDEIINHPLNRFVGDRADYDRDEDDPHGHGKRVPYIGWFWRDVNFAQSAYTIGHCGGFVGFMENNKWGYPQRYLTPDEAAKVTEVVCDAYDLSRAGGIVSEIIASTNAKLSELWDLLQTFPMAIDGFWIHGPQGLVAFADDQESADELIDSLSTAGGVRYWMTKASA